MVPTGATLPRPSEDEATKRVRVARIALVSPQVFDELGGHRNHMTGLFLLAKHLTPDNAPELLAVARGKTRMQISELIARRFLFLSRDR